MADEKKKKSKRPTALKRLICSKKKNLINKAFKSKMRTTLRSFNELVAKGEKSLAEDALKKVYSVLDKAAKRNLLKKNKASRIKQRLTLRANAQVA